MTTGDNWNATNTDAIANAIGALKRRYHARKVVVVGHSGGAAIAANILGRHPELIDAALLVSCPYDSEK
jgi:pimeloyl-ACP methyl ester carboxylesterase